MPAKGQTARTQRICTGRIVIAKEDLGRCAEITIEPRSPYCYWHRLDRTTYPGQARAAELRLSAAPVPRKQRVPPADWPDGKRWCAGCQSFVPLWYCQGSKCRACTRAVAAATRRRETYGLHDEDWDAILELQGGRCAICRNRSRDRTPAVEHDHGTGMIRGAACKNCNHDLLGAAHDSPRRLLAAAMYLIAPPTSGRWVRPEDGLDAVVAAVTDTLDRLYREGRARTLATEALSSLDPSLLDQLDAEIEG
jgi:hypothetical protein